MVTQNFFYKGVRGSSIYPVTVNSLFRLSRTNENNKVFVYDKKSE